MIVQELINLFGFKVDDQQLNKAQKRLDGFVKGIKFAAFGTVAAIAAIGTAAVVTAADMESLNAEFEVMLGSAEAAKGMVEDLTSFAARTPFALKDLGEGARTLLSFGIAQEKILPTLQQLGDVAGKDKEKFKSLTLAFAQVQSTGKLMGQDLLQMINAGFNPLKTLADQSGKSIGQLKEEMSKGAISAQDVAEAFRIATSEGGMFFGNMEKQSKTLGGLISTLKDNISLVLVDIGNKLLPLIKKIVGRLTELFQGTLGRILDDLVTSLQPILTIFFDLFERVLTAIEPLLKILPELSAMFANVFGAALELIVPLINFFVEFLTPILGVVIELFNQFIPPLLKILKKVIEPLMKIFMLLMPLIIATLERIGPMLDLFLVVADSLAELLIALMPLLEPLIKGLVFLLTILTKISTYINTVFVKIFSAVLQKITGWIVGLINLIGGPLGMVIEKIKESFSGFGQIVKNIFIGVVKIITAAINGLLALANKTIDWVNKIPGVNFEQVALLDPKKILDKLTKESITTNRRGDTIVTVNNDMTFEGETNTKKGMKKMIDVASKNTFNIQLKKLVIDAGV